MTVFHPHPFFLAAAAGHGEQRVIIFFAQASLLFKAVDVVIPMSLPHARFIIS